MIHYVNIDTSTNTDISPADLLAAANDAGLTISQFEAKAINDAVQRYKLEQAKRFTPLPKEDIHAIPKRG